MFHQANAAQDYIFVSRLYIPDIAVNVPERISAVLRKGWRNPKELQNLLAAVCNFLFSRARQRGYVVTSEDFQSVNLGR